MTPTPTNTEGPGYSYKNTPIFGTLENKVDILTWHVEEQDRRIDRLHEDIEALHHMIMFLVALPRLIEG